MRSDRLEVEVAVEEGVVRYKVLVTYIGHVGEMGRGGAPSGARLAPSGHGGQAGTPYPYCSPRKEQYG